MKSDIKDICKSIERIDEYLRGKLRKAQLWENTYICKQISKRKAGYEFIIKDHIRAMVYSMLSSGAAWERLEKHTDLKTGRILPIDEIFYQYEPEALLKSKPDKIYNSVKELGCGSQYTHKQIKALTEVNIGTFHRLERQFGSVDNFYNRFTEADGSLKTLVLVLSSSDSPFKLKQMGEALTAEYLKNVGYDIAKPDRHIRRILGSDILDCSDKKDVPIYEAFDIVAEIAKEMKTPVAEVDYILWSYCATGYGEICTMNKPKCNLCVTTKNCKVTRGGIRYG